MSAGRHRRRSLAISLDDSCRAQQPVGGLQRLGAEPRGPDPGDPSGSAPRWPRHWPSGARRAWSGASSGGRRYRRCAGFSSQQVQAGAGCRPPTRAPARGDAAAGQRSGPTVRARGLAGSRSDSKNASREARSDDSAGMTNSNAARRSGLPMRSRCAARISALPGTPRTARPWASAVKSRSASGTPGNFFLFPPDALEPCRRFRRQGGVAVRPEPGCREAAAVGLDRSTPQQRLDLGRQGRSTLRRQVAPVRRGQVAEDARDVSARPSPPAAPAARGRSAHRGPRRPRASTPRSDTQPIARVKGSSMAGRSASR